MSTFHGSPNFAHGQTETIGILLVNLGTPDAPTPKAVRRYLKEFLSDPRVVEVPRLLWWLILNGIILNLRPRRSAHAYAQVWTAEGSPLLVLTRRVAARLQQALDAARPAAAAARARYAQISLWMRRWWCWPWQWQRRCRWT